MGPKVVGVCLIVKLHPVVDFPGSRDDLKYQTHIQGKTGSDLIAVLQVQPVLPVSESPVEISKGKIERGGGSFQKILYSSAPKIVGKCKGTPSVVALQIIDLNARRPPSKTQLMVPLLMGDIEISAESVLEPSARKRVAGPNRAPISQIAAKTDVRHLLQT